MYDLLLKNGALTNSEGELDGSIGDLAIKDGVIECIDKHIQSEAKNTVDLKGLTVIPGLIDYHAHFFSGGTNTSLEFASYLPTGVTNAVDAGSAGDSNMVSFLEILTERERRNTKFFLNVSSEGLSCLGEHAENIHPQYFNDNKIARLCKSYPDLIIGLKIRISADIADFSRTTSFDALRGAVRIADACGIRISVHMPDFQGELSELIDILRPGDIFCHVFTPHKGILEDGKLSREIFRGREKGILFESACGKGHFGHEVAAQAIQAGFLPDIISGDLTRNTFGNLPAVSLPYLMSRFMALGMSFREVLRCVTTVPAELMNCEGRFGCLQKGAVANIAIMERRQGKFFFDDVKNHEVKGEELLIPMGTILDGEWVFNQVNYFGR